MPADTVLVVGYQGSETETFALTPSAHARANEDVCCRLGTPASGALPAIVCDKSPAVTPVLGADARAPSEGGAPDASGPPADSGKAAASGVDATVSLPHGLDGSAPDARAYGVDASSAADATSDAQAAPPAPLAPRALFCELRTNGPATVRVTAAGYAPLDQELKSRLRDDGCGVKTVDIRLALSRPDGGRF